MQLTPSHLSKPCTNISRQRRTYGRVPAWFAAIALVLLIPPFAAPHPVRAEETPSRAESGMFLRVQPPVRLVSADGKRFDAHTLDTLQPGDRIEIGRGGSAEVVFDATGKRYRLSVAASATGSRGANSGDVGSVRINRAGSDLAPPSEATAGPKVAIAVLHTVSARLAARFSVEGRIGPKSGSVAVRDLGGLGRLDLLEDALADPTHDAVVRWETASKAGPSATGAVIIYRLGPVREGVKTAEPVWHATLTAATPQVTLPGGTLRAGQRYRWSLHTQNTQTQDDAVKTSEPATMSGPLYVLSDEQHAALIADLADLHDNTPDVDLSDPTPLMQEALILRHYSLWSETADTLRAVLARRNDPALRASADSLLDHPLSIRPATGAVMGTATGATPAVP